MITVENCPACGATSFKDVFKAPYFRGDGKQFQIQECLNCNLWITNPRPADDDLAGYYTPDNYISHTDQNESLVDKIYHLVREYSLKKKVALISSLGTPGKKLLDYGAGTGYFLASAKANGWEVDGVEPSKEARRVALKENNIHLVDPNGAELTPGSYDVITLWHVLEHLPDLRGHLQKFAALLKEGGCLVIAVPNHESFDSQWYKENWAALDVPLHLYHFKKSNIKFLAEGTDLKLEQIKNMPFDSFYVSMLSEKIENGSNNFLRAFYRGLRSNIKGMSEKNASSLIYIIRKPQ